MGVQACRSTSITSGLSSTIIHDALDFPGIEPSRAGPTRLHGPRSGFTHATCVVPVPSQVGLNACTHNATGLVSMTATLIAVRVFLRICCRVKEQTPDLKARRIRASIIMRSRHPHVLAISPTFFNPFKEPRLRARPCDRLRIRMNPVTGPFSPSFSMLRLASASSPV